MNYKHIILPEGRKGEFREARVKNAASTYLLGEIIT